MAISEKVYEMITGEDDGRVCKDIPDSACREQPNNFVTHVASLAATKSGDGLADPKLVLTWLLNALGAPAFLIGVLVPIREAGALLPQMLIASWVRSLPQRKWVWALGSLIQGVSVFGMAMAVLLLPGELAGWLIVGLLVCASVARSFCSVSYKDVLGKTVSKTTRGTATGTAAMIAAILILLFGAGLSLGIFSKTIGVIAGGLLLAAACWLFAAALFSTLEEEPGATQGGGNPLAVAREQMGLLQRDPQLVRFIGVRGLLIATALAPPYIVLLAGESKDAQLGDLGMFVLASSSAAIVSTYIWGRLSDQSSRKVLSLAGLLAAVALAVVTVLAVAMPQRLQQTWLTPVMLFFLMIAYQGVRLGRSTHLVDMAARDQRAAYTALSNTIIGVLLIVGSVFGVIAQWFGNPAVLSLFTLMCIAAAWLALGLEEVQS